ncbi:MAG: helix-hairpin-helix domain-containing protein [Oscillospiraceae bacterium]|nr:helix-hairpin-helix domain-containing protein [Oscillospiraceae bacterium]
MKRNQTKRRALPKLTRAELLAVRLPPAVLGGGRVGPRAGQQRAAHVSVMPSVAAAAMAAEKTEAQTAYININTASAVELQTLPGIGEVLSARIVDYREEHGTFAQIEDIKNVYGIGDGIFSNIQARITVGAATVRAEEDDDR